MCSLKVSSQSSELGEQNKTEKGDELGLHIECKLEIICQVIFLNLFILQASQKKFTQKFRELIISQIGTENKLKTITYYEKGNEKKIDEIKGEYFSVLS